MSETKVLNMLNEIARNLGLCPRRRRHSFLWWPIPKDWTGTNYLFAYTPWKTQDKGKVGFFAVKIRVLKSGAHKIVKKVRFAKRKIARDRSKKWFIDYYKKEPFT